MRDLIGADEVTLLCALARMLPFTLLVPLGARFVPRSVSFSFIVLLAFATLGTNRNAALDLAQTQVLFLIARELCIGLLLALACAFPLAALSAVGAVADRFGASASSSGPYARLYELSALTAFFALGGARALVRALADVERAAPLANPSFVREGFLLGALVLGREAVLLSLGLALPLLSALWLSDFAITLVDRAFSSSPRPILVSPVRAGLCALIVLVSIVPAIDAVPDALRRSLGLSLELVRSAFG